VFDEDFMADMMLDALRAVGVAAVWLMLLFAALGVYMLSPRAKLLSYRRQRARVSRVSASLLLICCCIAAWIYGIASGVIIVLAGCMVFLTIVPVLAVSFLRQPEVGNSNIHLDEGGS
jgi:UPF0716 family protein affecting phage T7 exclusion